MRLKPSGVARFVSAAFLVFWLCGWAVGEGIALWVLAKGILALMNGTPFEEGRAPLELGPALAIGGFLLLWLSLWTLGGVAAIAHVLQLLWSEDRLIAHGGGLTVVRSRGPFRGRRELPRDMLRRIVLVPRCDALAAETTRERIELSRLGTHAEREETATALRSQLGLNEAAFEAEAVTLPKGWEEVITPEGERAVAVSAATRRAQSRVVGVLALLVATIAFSIFQQAARELAMLPMGIIATLGAAGLVWAAVWLARGRMEWRIGNGYVTLRRRFGSTSEDLFEARRLELVISTDSDGDEWIHLEGLKGSLETPALGHWSQGHSKNRRRIASTMNEPTVPRLLGAWLARAANIPIEDRTSRENQEAEVKLSLDQLEKSGPLGRAAARFIGAAIDRGRKSA